MTSTFKDQIAQRVQIQSVARVSFGSPGTVVMNIEAGLRRFPFINVVQALTRRHAPLRKAVRAVERAAETGFALIDVPMIEDAEALIAELAANQVTATVREPEEATERTVNVADIREAFKLTQEEFAEAFDLDLATLRGWEQGRREPDRATKAYLQVIAAEPETVVGILHKKRVSKTDTVAAE